MASPSQGPTESSPSRPTKTLASTRSFTRLESLPPPARSRSTTLSSFTSPNGAELPGTLPESNFTYGPLEGPESPQPIGHDRDKDNDHDDLDESFAELELPAEVLGMTNSFIESLSAKVHPAPVSIDLLSTMFQDFYETAAAAISTHVSKLYSSQDTHGPDQPLVSMSEIAQRKKIRKRKDGLRIALQEMVEERLTEAVFDKIWRHYGAEDEARDEALRSKTLALGVVGIGLKELGLEENIDVMDLQPVCEALQGLNNTKCPHGKIQLLKRAHKAIVDALTSVVPSTTSSADHILPVLIYSLIISPPHIFIVSNLLYIQRFRYHKAIDGEAAYCLTNLEAAISFLETVDMGTLSVNELHTNGPTDLESSVNPVISLPLFTDAAGKPAVSVVAPAITSTSPIHASPGPDVGHEKETLTIAPGTSPARRMTYLTPVEFATSAATSAVNTADQSLKTIGNSLENSYRFLFGRLSDKRTDLPKTLEDVRKLVGTPTHEPSRAPPAEDNSINNERPKSGASQVDGFITSMIRVASSDSSRKSVRGPISNAPPEHEATSNMSLTPTEFSNNGMTYAPVAESVRNIGSHLGRFAGNINVIRSFSRGPLPKSLPAGPVSTDFDPVESPSALPLEQKVVKLDPPISRFLDAEVANLRIGDVELLLQDYQRLAAALKSTGAFQ